MGSSVVYEVSCATGRGSTGDACSDVLWTTLRGILCSHGCVYFSEFRRDGQCGGQVREPFPRANAPFFLALVMTRSQGQTALPATDNGLGANPMTVSHIGEGGTWDMHACCATRVHTCIHTDTALPLAPCSSSTEQLFTPRSKAPKAKNTSGKPSTADVVSRVPHVHSQYTQDTRARWQRS